MASREYKYSWMKSSRKKKREQEMIAKGRCPKCEVILALSPNHDCSNYDWKILDE